MCDVSHHIPQQYFFEFAFDEIKARPRHVCPYAVVSFQYKGKEAAATSMTALRCVCRQEMVNPTSVLMQQTSPEARVLHRGLFSPPTG